MNYSPRSLELHLHERDVTSRSARTVPKANSEVLQPESAERAMSTVTP